MNIIDATINELNEWERKVFDFVKERMPETLIEQSLNSWQADPHNFHSRMKDLYGMSPSICNAIIGLSAIRSLLEQKISPIPDTIPTSNAAHIARNAFHAGLFIGMANPGYGMEVLGWELQNAEKNVKQRSSKIAHDARYAQLREFKEKAAKIARQLWETGLKLSHDKMAKHLIENYQDETGKHPFMHLPNSNEAPDKVLLEVVKDVAKKIKRPDLISGQKKS